MEVFGGSVQSRSPGQTFNVGKRVGQSVRPPQVIALYGELGAGKTCFTQGVARGVGIEQKVTSPTYSLIQEYPGRYLMVHIDCYRLTGEDDAVDIGLVEILSKFAIVLVEWPERIKRLLPEKCLEIYMEIVNETTRSISIKNGEPV